MIYLAQSVVRMSVEEIYDISKTVLESQVGKAASLDCRVKRTANVVTNGNIVPVFFYESFCYCQRVFPSGKKKLVADQQKKGHTPFARTNHITQKEQKSMATERCHNSRNRIHTKHFFAGIRPRICPALLALYNTTVLILFRQSLCSSIARVLR